VPRLRSAVTEFAESQRVVDPPINDVRLAVSEAVTNAVLHGYEKGAPGQIRVALTVDWPTSELRLVVTDDGMGMNPRPDSPGLGLGLPMIAALTQTMEVRTPAAGQGTELCMTFGLSSVA
jgi:serine/threonine-protein kinase RsbW/stage II sporulation protein AB (anti-sigma F factor)